MQHHQLYRRQRGTDTTPPQPQTGPRKLSAAARKDFRRRQPQNPSAQLSELSLQDAGRRIKIGNGQFTFGSDQKTNSVEIGPETQTERDAHAAEGNYHGHVVPS